MRLLLRHVGRIPQMVKETHGESKTAKEYLMLADLMEYKFSREMDVEEEVNQ